MKNMEKFIDVCDYIIDRLSKFVLNFVIFVKKNYIVIYHLILLVWLLYLQFKYFLSRN